jgi:hypothetical protein
MKKWYESKTVWFNALAFLVAVIGPILSQYGYTGDIPAGLAVFVPAAIAAINLILRKLTSSAIG